MNIEQQIRTRRLEREVSLLVEGIAGVGQSIKHNPEKSDKPKLIQEREMLRAELKQARSDLRKIRRKAKKPLVVGQPVKFRPYPGKELSGQYLGIDERSGRALIRVDGPTKFVGKWKVEQSEVLS